jgi:hypothetical protein
MECAAKRLHCHFHLLLENDRGGRSAYRRETTVNTTLFPHVSCLQTMLVASFNRNSIQHCV